MHERDYPDFSLSGRTWSVVGSQCGQMTRNFFRPDEGTPCKQSPRSRSWIWVDEFLENQQADIFTDAHSPHEYSGYDLHVRKQPVITTFANHDHLIIPDLDVEREGDQTVSIILHTDFIWTRRSERIEGFDRLLESAELSSRGPLHDTAVYAFVGILRVLLEGLDRQLANRERQTYALEDLFLRREQDCSVGPSSFDQLASGDQDSLHKPHGMSERNKLVELRIGIAWLRKQYDAFERVVNDLQDPAHGAFRRKDAPTPEEETSPYFQHLSDQIKRALTKIEHLRDIQSTLDQLLTSHEAEKTNRTLLRLTWVSFIFLPMSFVASVWGMNVSLFQAYHNLGRDTLFAAGTLAVAFLTANAVYMLAKRT